MNYNNGLDKAIEMTLNYYDEYAEEFNNDTVSVEFSELHNILLKYINKKSHILDLGCGSGRDSKVFIENGYKVTAIDGSIEMCKIASEYIGQEVIYKKFNEIDYESKFDAVWACSSLLHIPYDYLNSIIYNISKSLKIGGYLYSTFKYGDFEGEINGRYFTNLTEKSVLLLIEEFEELEIVEMSITKDKRPGREKEEWLNVVIKKIDITNIN